MKAQKTMIAVGIALALAGSYAQAASKEDYKKVVVYGEVTLDKDSAHEWGPWTQFEAPAAGPAPVAPTLVAAIPEIPPEIIPPVLPPVIDNVCQAGDWCGYSVAVKGNDGRPYNSRERGRGHAGQFGLTHNPENVDSVEGNGTVAFRTASFDGAVVGQTEEGYDRESGTYYDEYNKVHFNSAGYDQAAAPTGHDYDAEGKHISVYRYVTGGRFRVDANHYVDTFDGIEGRYVAGDTTSAAGMQNLNAGNVRAHYSGYTGGNQLGSYDGDALPSQRVDVEMEVDFGAGTFDATFNGGCDGCGSNGNYVYTDSTTEGNVIQGGVGFTAAGGLTDNGFQSTSVGSTDAQHYEISSDRVSVTGSVVGYFYGPGAQAVGGVADIQKTVDYAEDSYSGTYTDVFVADKVDVQSPE